MEGIKSTMRMALVSERPAIGDTQKNLECMKRYIDENEADLFIFAEMFLTGYPCKDEWRDLAESLDGPSIAYMKKVAKKNDCCILFGMPLKDDRIKAIVYNAAILIQPDGHVDHYEKWYLPTFGPFEEKIYFDEGERLPVFDTPYGRIGIVICYDLYFPELSKALALQGIDILVCMSASPSTTRRFFEMLLPARALENTVFVAYVNLVGAQEDMVFWGGAQAYDALGTCLVKAPYFEESIVFCEVDPESLSLMRPNRPVLRDTRAEIFSDMAALARFKAK